ncbi:hypothetical protein A3D08_00400 [Candidatus Roizmanbacteria bacterium RIFCSPHIGHO2_02_FULL_43_11]|uniref:Peptidase S11 D-alanyl-D-alanine carboxypeptidase A N-terminal domain-containing protein n=1 Tax=Candidatus Roizmanbacteria bacterium RIFCSPHIGHO2_02_FULL_43_11 TaxID=1802043 RepID=A0A1F7HGM2_9BACT|nr:MAG: hypothetical protein A3D08_00400 [Candidatus Roizmanbacteria bacterium RIFCSPHIGHO2_02_FULL_43_11]
MPKKKPEQVSTSQVPKAFYVRASLAITFFALILLFYPGYSFYTSLFSYQRDMFLSGERRTKEYQVLYVPYVKPQIATPSLTAISVYLIDLKTATPLYEKNQHMRLFPASTTKVITALTAMDKFTFDDVLVTKRVVNDGQLMDLVLGEKMTFENVLYGLLVHSGNDAAYMIADSYPGGDNAFIKAMNAKAAALKMRNSHFDNPAGLDSAALYSSAFDLSLAARELLKNHELARIVSIKSITVSDVDYTHFHYLMNVNQLLGKIPGIGGLKTGKTDLAGENLITLYKKNGHEFLIVLLKSEDRFADTQALVEWIGQNVNYATL